MRWIGECPRESELSDGNALETLKAAFFQKLREARVLASDGDRQELLWDWRGQQRSLRPATSPHPGGSHGHPLQGALCHRARAGGSPLGVWGWGELFQGWAPRQQWGWKSPGGQKLGHKHVVSGVWRAVCPSES